MSRLMEPPSLSQHHHHSHPHLHNNMIAASTSAISSKSISTTSHPQQSRQHQVPTNFTPLMTPEEPLIGSFSSQEHQQHDEKSDRLAPIYDRIGLQSPPTSPPVPILPDINTLTGHPPSPQYTQQNNHVTGYGQESSTSAHHTPRFDDSALFPAVEGEHIQPQSPLFSQRDRDPTTPPRVVVEPRSDSVAFSLDFPYSLDIRTPQQAERYWRSCCADAAKLGRIQLPLPRSVSTARRDPISVRQLQSIERPGAQLRTRPASQRSHNRVVKPALSPRRTSVGMHTRRTPARPVQRAHTPTPPPPPSGPAAVAPPTSFSAALTARASPAPRRLSHKASPSDDGKASKHRRAPASKERAVGEAWDKLPDYCPPLSSLATAPKPLKARPVGSSGALDLSHDPDRMHLHPDELAVASTLRLQCAKYLLNKRKIFKAKVEHLRASAVAAASASPGSRASVVAAVANFNKTEAQKACGIDVNKASSLFQAFEDVGWFQRDWFVQYL